MSIDNSVKLIGRLTRDPELKFTTGSGIAVANFSLAVDKRYVKDKPKEVNFINCIAWREKAELIANNLGKGRLVAIDGSIEVSSYKNQEGKNVQKVEVLVEEIKFLDWPKDGTGTKDTSTEETGFFPTDEDIPF